MSHIPKLFTYMSPKWKILEFVFLILNPYSILLRKDSIMPWTGLSKWGPPTPIPPCRMTPTGNQARGRKLVLQSKSHPSSLARKMYLHILVNSTFFNMSSGRMLKAHFLLWCPVICVLSLYSPLAQKTFLSVEWVLVHGLVLLPYSLFFPDVPRSSLFIGLCLRLYTSLTSFTGFCN